MKLRELNLCEEDPNIYKKVDTWVALYIESPKPAWAYEWHNGKIRLRFSGQVCLQDPHQQLESLPYKFANLPNDSFIASNIKKLKSFENFPDVVNGLSVVSTSISSLEGMPKINRGDLHIANCPIYDLTRMDKAFSKKQLNGFIWYDWGYIKEGGISLMLLNGVKGLIGAMGGPPRHEPFRIIHEHIMKKSSIFDCQAELIDRGFEEFAIL